MDNPLARPCREDVPSVQGAPPTLAQEADRPRALRVLAEDSDREALAPLTVSKPQGGLRVAAAKAQGLGDHHGACLHKH